jgi:hypothetical protein
MLSRRISGFALAVMMAVASLAMTANAQERKTVSDSTQTINLSNAQVFKIQGLLGSQTRELQSLNAQVQSSRESLAAALAENEPVRISMAVLALDAAEKALENTKRANQRDLQSLLNENQKQILKNYLSKSTSSSD